ncbi:MAG: hypothetical protein E6H09_13275 [Bacteroidetes bacterium]|jgi:hypothetical protein|nr:MAG: hypothetical protein E6H09_13275 [Bacteroidota bacterium]
MRSAIFSILFLLICQAGHSQTDYSGVYSFSYKPLFDPKGKRPSKEEANDGPSGGLSVLLVDKTHYKFWLDVGKGWPNYHIGYINGIMTITGNRGIFKEKQDYSDSSCTLYFSFSAKSVSITQQGTDVDCGFGANVYADGTYKKRNARKITVAEFSDLYFDAPRYNITADKAYVFEDSSGLKSKNQYFVKNDELISVNESTGFIYIEHLTSSGKFIYGWIRKSETDFK